MRMFVGGAWKKRGCLWVGLGRERILVGGAGKREDVGGWGQEEGGCWWVGLERERILVGGARKREDGGWGWEERGCW